MYGAVPYLLSGRRAILHNMVAVSAGPTHWVDDGQTYRLNDFLTEAQVADVCAEPTITAAMDALVPMIAPHGRINVRALSDSRFVGLISMVIDDKIGCAAFGELDEAAWVDAAGPAHAWRRHGRLNQVLTRGGHTANTITALLTETPDLATAGSVLYEAAVGVWWDTCLRDGCTPHTARTMLALCISPAILAMLDFTQSHTGTAPTFKGNALYREHPADHLAMP